MCNIDHQQRRVHGTKNEERRGGSAEGAGREHREHTKPRTGKRVTKKEEMIFYRNMIFNNPR